MKVLQLNIGDYVQSGGTGIAMQLLHLGLRKAGIDSKIICEFQQLESSHTVKVPHFQQFKKLEQIIATVGWRYGLYDIYVTSSFKIKGMKVYLDADILNLHCIHTGWFNYLTLPSLTESKPAVYTLHDMWAFTGHCSFNYDCDRWKSGCGHCPYPDTHPPIYRDTTHLHWKLKNWVYSRSNLTIVTPSAWMAEQAKQGMLNRFPIHHIPNGVDSEVYQPLDPEQCRSELGIPTGKKVLMFGAARPNEYRKGGDLLCKALQSLPESLKAETVLLTFGDEREAITEPVGIQSLNLGLVKSDRRKVIAYSAADLFLCPTRAESFGLVVLESMACGTPVVSFRTSAIPELVRPGITGYLAEPEDAEDFRDGIVQLLEDESLRNYMGQQCRDIVLREYTLDLYVQRYTELYRQIVRNGSK